MTLDSEDRWHVAKGIIALICVALVVVSGVIAFNDGAPYAAASLMAVSGLYALWFIEQVERDYA